MTDWRRATVEKVAEGVLWFFRLIKGWLPRVLGGAASLALIVWGTYGDRVWTSGLTFFVVGVVLTGAALLAELIVQRPSYMKLSQMREDADRKADAKSVALERAIRIMLIRLAKHLGLEGHSDRLSVYFFHEDRFFMVSRHAKNPSYEKRGRESYPSSEGAIGAAWSAEQGQAIVNMPAANEAWRKAARKQGLSDEAINGMSMKSLGLAGYRLETGDTSVGVLVVESTVAHRVVQEHLDKICDSHIVAAVTELVAAFAMMTPAGESLAAAKTSKPPRKWQLVSPKVPLAPQSQ